MNIESLIKKYQKFKEEDTLMENIFEIKEDILSSDSDEFLEFHYSFLDEKSLQSGIKNMIISFFYSEILNKRDIAKVSLFLFEKYQNEKVIDKKVTVLKILGHLRSDYCKDIIKNDIVSLERNLRYGCIIVLGWVGTTIKDIEILNNRMINDIDPVLRGYSATAMRQIWYNKKSTKNRITKYISNALPLELDDEALSGMIITLQDLHKKKFGIKESKYGDISGDISIAKEKAVKFLDKL